MSFKGVYQNFLANPSTALLNDEASLNYITTLTTINSAAAVVKHFEAHQKILKKTEEKTLNSIESDDAVCLEIETTIEFTSSGGAYLPGLDDNFLADRVVTFPIIHIVHFDGNRKIQAIRLSWDQGSLLKQIDVIGARARSWPIRDGKDQARLVASSAAAALRLSGAGKPPSTASNTAGQASAESGTSNGARSSTNTNVTRDPHASLALFSPHGDYDAKPPTHDSGVATKGSSRPPQRAYGDLFGNDDNWDAKANAVRPETHNNIGKAQSAKPAPRDYHDIFAGGEEDASPASKGKPSSPLKNITSPGAPKAGAGKNFQPMRLYDDVGDQFQDEVPDKPQTTGQKFVKPDPKKYDHFEFGQYEDAKPPQHQHQSLLSRPISSKHQSQWDFEDFMTPNKVPQKIRGQDQRHFGWSDDEPNMDSPPKKAPPKPRPDADAHFDFVDDATPAGERRAAEHPRGLGGNPKSGMGLYKNDLFDDEEGSTNDAGRPLSTISNPKDRRKHLESQFGLSDTASPNDNGPSKQFPGHKTAAIQTMSANWSAADESPAPAHFDRTSSHHPFGRTAAKGKENFPTAAGHRNIGIKSAGDGMGGKKGSGRAWGFGDDSDGEEAGGRNTGSFRAQRKQQAPVETTEWDF